MLNKIVTAAAIAGIFAVGAVAALAGILPPTPAEARSVNGYTYTRLICQEYGGQPGWYWVRDQGNYGWQARNSGWMLVLTRGGGTTYRVDANGAYVRAIDDEVYEDGEYLEFLPDGNGNPRREERRVTGGYLWWDPGPLQEWVKVGSGATDADYVRVTRSLGGSFDRYTRTATGGGSVRWANMRYCR